jgi:hypothetical protein
MFLQSLNEILQILTRFKRGEVSKEISAIWKLIYDNLFSPSVTLLSSEFGQNCFITINDTILLTLTT